jgi:Ca2+-transporting ATPase
LALDAQGNLTSVEAEAIAQQVDAMAKQGLRVLRFAKKNVTDDRHSVDHPDIEAGLIFLGLQGMIDPPRPEAIAAVHACQRAGVQVKMISGDHAPSSRQILEL